MAPRYDYKIATLAAGTGGLTNVESLATPVSAPKSEFHPWFESVPLGDGTVRGAGYPYAIWRWGYLTRAQRDQLRTYCTGKSTAVYIRTKTNDSSDSYANYSAIMVWPDAEERDADVRIDFSIEFRWLVVQP